MQFYNCAIAVDENLTSVESATKLLWVVFSPIIFLVGMTANILALIVLYRVQQQTCSVGVTYRFVLAISDMTILCTGLSRYWILYLFNCDIRQISNAGCKINLFVIYVSMQYSSWVLVSLTVQRCFVVYDPLRFKRIWTVKMSWIQLSILFVFLSLIDCHYFFTNGIRDGACDSLTDEIWHFEEHYFVFIDLAILCLIPFLIMFAGNLYFLKNMRGIREIRRSLTEGQRATRPRQQNTKLIMKMTWLFLLTTLPISVQMIADSFIQEYDEEKDLAKAVCYLFQYFGVSLNIVIYITNDRSFRQQFRILFNLKHTEERLFCDQVLTLTRRDLQIIDRTRQNLKMIEVFKGFVRRGTTNSLFQQTFSSSSSTSRSLPSSTKKTANSSIMNKTTGQQADGITTVIKSNCNQEENSFISTHM